MVHQKSPPVPRTATRGVHRPRADSKKVDSAKLDVAKPPPVQHKIHRIAVSKLERSMGYGREDIEEALRHPEPSAIKDAFSIVVENEMMQTNCKN
jgi:Ubiquitin associated domain (UBA).